MSDGDFERRVLNWLGEADVPTAERIRGAAEVRLDRLRRGPGSGDAESGEVIEWQGMIVGCQPMQKVRDLVQKFAPTQAPVLIQGESGTGKELIAKALHTLSHRGQQAMVSENCAAIPATLMESTLFGHVRGAFTGAVKDHPGHFVAADGGTLFLDEIGDMPLAMQAKLLRVLQEGEVRPVGGSKVRHVDVRVLAATHRNLDEMVAEGSFREDLMYRLNALTVPVPPLRERGGDVLALAERFLAKAAARNGRELALGAAARERIAQARWPGNVRQLFHEMQRIATLADGPEVGVADLSAEIQKPRS